MSRSLGVGLPPVDKEVVQTLAGLNASASLAVVQRTRRAVFLAAAELRARRSRARRNAAVVGLSFAALLMVLTPAIWSSVDDFLGGDEFLEVKSMVMVLILLLFSAMMGALVIGLRYDYLRMPDKRR